MNSLAQRNTILQESYQLLVEDCKAILTESTFTSRWILIEGYWHLGERIREEKNTTDLVQHIAVDIGISERTLWNALKLYDKYPDIDHLPEGKNISWTKLINKYLPDNPIENKIEIHKCPICGGNLEASCHTKQ